MENFRGLASNREDFPVNFFFFIIRCFELLYNREIFPANNKKTMQLRNFSTANDLRYTVIDLSTRFRQLRWNIMILVSYRQRGVPKESILSDETIDSQLRERSGTYSWYTNHLQLVKLC